MQLLLIAGIGIALVAVTFALQNNVAVAVAVLAWRFESTLAVVILLAVGLGALIAGLVSSPAVIRDRWQGARLRRQVAELEAAKAVMLQKIAGLERELATLRPAPPDPAPETRPYVGLKELMSGGRPPDAGA